MQKNTTTLCFSFYCGFTFLRHILLYVNCLSLNRCKAKCVKFYCHLMVKKHIAINVNVIIHVSIFHSIYCQ